MGSSTPKSFLDLEGRPIVLRTLDVFVNLGLAQDLVIVTAGGDVEPMRLLVEAAFGERLKPAIVSGGPVRQESVYNGLQAIGSGAGIVVIHDAVRPFVEPRCVTESIEAARAHGAAIVACPAVDTIVEAEPDGFLSQTLNRESLWHVQTPQTFRRELIVEAHENARKDGVVATDDAALVRRMDRPVCIVRGARSNIKITTPEDLAFASELVRSSST